MALSVLVWLNRLAPWFFTWCVHKSYRYVQIKPGTVAIAASPYATSDSGQTRQAESVERGTPLRFNEKHVYKTAAGAHGSVDNSADIAAAFLKNLASKTGCPIAGKATDAAVSRFSLCRKKPFWQPQRKP
jgi:hypothetical protein